MKSAYTSIIAASMLAASGVSAQESGIALGQGFKVDGSVSVGGLKLNEHAYGDNPYRLKEYRDVGSGLLAAFDLRGRGTDYYVNAFAENLGRDDQGVDIRGGRYNSFKYQIFESRLVHNWTFDARTPYTGIGTDTLTASLGNAASLDSRQWNQFDFRKKRDNVGAMFEAWAGSPWFVRVDANEVTEHGLQLVGGPNSTSPGGGFTDKPFPIDYTTRNVSVETGYATKKAQFSVNLAHSTFTNANDMLRWSNGFFANQLDTTWLPPDNQYSKIGVNANLKQLPYGSTLASRLTYSKTTSSFPIASSALNTGGAFNATNPDHDTFDGDVVHKTGSLSLHSNPTSQIDTRVYLNYFRKDNGSTNVAFNPGAGLNCGGVTCLTENLNYKKNNLGIDLGYRVNSTNRVVLGADYVDLDRNRVDFDETRDKTARIEWRNTSLDWLSTRVKYQRLQRRSHFLEGNSGTGPSDPQYLDRFIARFDASNVNQDLFKVGIDLTPAELWDIGLEAIVKNNNYKDTVLGRTKDERQELYFSVAHGDPGKFRVMLFGDVEFVKYDAVHRNISQTTGGPAATAYDPFSAPACTGGSCNYNWDATNRDRSWAIGIGADWLPTARLKMNGSIISQWTHGTADFSVQSTPNPINPTADKIYNFDNSRKLTMNLKGTYMVSRHWDVTAGYAYERFRFSDIAIDGYLNVVSPGGTGITSTSYLSGAYANPNYNATIVYLTGTYKF